MRDGVRLRRAVRDDAATVARLLEAMALEMGATPEAEYRQRCESAWLADVEHRPTWLAEHNGTHVGILVALLVDNLPWPGQAPRRWAHISHVYVVPECRDVGVGHTLLETMLQWGQSHAVDRVQLNANARSARLYRRAGFDTAPPRLLELRLPRT